jgi:predicted RNA-binding Zn-ribbon protein involved in translation (DUF1610 family)
MKGTFYCESCGAEVKADVDSCPSCGRSFIAVRCPQCGHEGTSREFRDGCPGCGYLDDSDAIEPIKTPFRRKEWPASRYWTLSILLIVTISMILFFWLR